MNTSTTFTKPNAKGEAQHPAYRPVRTIIMKPARSLKVREVSGELGRYVVESHSRPNAPYFVDLTERIDAVGRAHGRCNCTWFQTNANPNYERHGKFIPYRTDENGKVGIGVSECKHIAAARNHYHLHVTMPMLAKFNQGGD